MRAATHGRSAWEIDLSAASGLDPDIYLRADYNDSGRVNGTRAPWVENHLDPTHVNYTLYHWMSADIKVRRSYSAGAMRDHAAARRLSAPNLLMLGERVSFAWKEPACSFPCSCEFSGQYVGVVPTIELIGEIQFDAL